MGATAGMKHDPEASAAARLARARHLRRGSGILSDAKHHPRFHSQTLVRSVSLTINPQGVGLTLRVPPSGIREESERPRVIADPVGHFGRLSRGGWSPRLPRQEPEPMSYADATAFAASLAATLLVSIVVFEAGDGTHGAMPADEFDGEESMVKLELDPWA